MSSRPRNDRRPDPAGGGLGSVRNLALDQRWTQVELPRRARVEQADVIHHPLPALAINAPCPQVVTIHDLAFERLPDCFSPAFRRYASQMHRRAARGAQAVVAVSETTARDARARWGLDASKLVVALHGPGQEPQARRRGARRALPLHRRRRAAQEPRAPARRARPLPRRVQDGRGRQGPAARARGQSNRRAGRRALRARPGPRQAPQRHRRARAPVVARGLRPHAARGDVRGRARHRRPLAGPDGDVRRRRRCTSIRTTRTSSPSRSPSVARDATLRADLARRGRERAQATSAGRPRRAPTSLPIPSQRPDEGCDPRHARHPRVLQRLRNGRGAARQPAHAARPRGHRLLPPACRRPPPHRAQGRAPRPPARDPQQVPRHVQPHLPECDALRPPRPARRRAVLHRRQQPDVPHDARRRHPDGHQRRRAGLRPQQMARDRQGLPALRRAQRAEVVGHRDHRLARRRRDLRAALRPAHRGRALRRRRPRPHRHRDARAPGPRAAQVHPVRRAPGAREQPARARRGVQPHLRRAGARHEARRRRRRSRTRTTTSSRSSAPATRA